MTKAQYEMNRRRILKLELIIEQLQKDTNKMVLLMKNTHHKLDCHIKTIGLHKEES